MRAAVRAVAHAAGLAGTVLALHSPAFAADQAYSFYVLNQRTVALTAQYWNPILTYVSKTSGVPLELRLTKTAKDGNVIPVNFHHPMLRARW